MYTNRICTSSGVPRISQMKKLAGARTSALALVRMMPASTPTSSPINPLTTVSFSVIWAPCTNRSAY